MPLGQWIVSCEHLETTESESLDSSKKRIFISNLGENSSIVHRTFILSGACGGISLDCQQITRIRCSRISCFTSETNGFPLEIGKMCIDESNEQPVGGVFKIFDQAFLPQEDICIAILIVHQ